MDIRKLPKRDKIWDPNIKHSNLPERENKTKKPSDKSPIYLPCHSKLRDLSARHAFCQPGNLWAFLPIVKLGQLQTSKKQKNKDYFTCSHMTEQEGEGVRGRLCKKQHLQWNQRSDRINLCRKIQPEYRSCSPGPRKPDFLAQRNVRTWIKTKKVQDCTAHKETSHFVQFAS